MKKKKKILITGGNGFLSKEIKKNLINNYIIISPNKTELNLLDKKSIKIFFKKYKYFDIVIHTAIVGGKRNILDSFDVFYNNLKMFFNLIEIKHRFKKLLNLASGASYDRNSDINGKNKILNANPDDYYGFSKNIIERIVLSSKNMYNLRIFNIFSENEIESRFIKTCITNIELNRDIFIENDRFFDFFYIKDFIKVIEYYICNDSNLYKDIDICYKKKYRLSEIALIIKNNKKSNVNIIINSKSVLNYIGNCNKLYEYKIVFDNEIELLGK